MTAPACAEHNRRIDDVRRSRDAAELSRLARPPVVERLDLDLTGREQARESGLSAPVAPHLADHARRNRD